MVKTSPVRLEGWLKSPNGLLPDLYLNCLNHLQMLAAQTFQPAVEGRRLAENGGRSRAIEHLRGIFPCSFANVQRCWLCVTLIDHDSVGIRAEDNVLDLVQQLGRKALGSLAKSSHG